MHYFYIKISTTLLSSTAQVQTFLSAASSELPGAK